MDSVTQALLGASIQGSLMGRVQGRRALAYGALLATLPDLDVLIRYSDPVSSMTFHRGFSHSLLVLTALAAALSWLIRKRWPDAPWHGRRLFITLWLVLITHPLLDAFTVYGTQLFWPFPVTPASWSAVFIIDPVYSVPMLLAVILAIITGLTRGAVRLLTIALLFSTAYLAFATGARVYTEHRARAMFREQHIEITELRAMPMPFTTLLWRVLAKTPDGDYYEQVSSLLDSQPPESGRGSRNLHLAQPLSQSPLHARLRWFTDDWLRYDTIGNALVVSDLRLGVAGYHNFRFNIAHCDDQGHWTLIPPTRWPRAQPDQEQLTAFARRILYQQPPLPLQAWLDRLQSHETTKCDPVPE